MGIKMVFSSVLFLFRFLPVFLICYYVAPGRMKNFILLLGSLFFYAWGEPVYVLLMLFSTVTDYFYGRMIEKYRDTGKAKIFLALSVLTNLSVLCFFKYADFLIQTVNGLFGTSVPLLNLPLPIGISFYTFQTMSYTIDVYRGEARVQKSLLDFGVFVTMFPQLIAGPIVKYRDVEERLESRPIDICTISNGMKRFCVGLAKKVLIANNVGELWAEISAMNFGEISALTAWIGVFAFAFQIYFDFSGYSDMAIGLGQLFGFEFPENFRYPYAARSVSDFWRRWHMTLSSFFRDYVYIPLGGNRKRWAVNMLLVWLLTGLWHGASWNFVLWGLYYFVFLMLEKIYLEKRLETLPKAVQHIYTMLVVLFGWVFFYFEDLSAIKAFFISAFGGHGFLNLTQSTVCVNYIAVLLVGAVLSCPILPYLKTVAHRLSAKRLGRASLNTACLLFVVGALAVATAALVGTSYNPFLYFRF